MTIDVPSALSAPDIVEWFVDKRVASRLAAGDSSLWGADSAERAASRLGWIDAIPRVNDVINRAETLVSSLQEIQYRRVILCGMGGSSLAPQVMSVNATRPLEPVDTLHPDAIDVRLSHERLNDAVVVVSSKSGSTSETRAQLALAEQRLRDLGIEPRERIVAITDPDSDLAHHAQREGYRLVLADPRVGGRYSALIEFGLVPTMLAGVNLSNFPEEANSVFASCSIDSAENPVLQVAAALASYAKRGITVQFTQQGLPKLPEWIEQLVAESTGHDGKGILPLPREFDRVTPTGGPVVALMGPSEELHRNSEETICVSGSLAGQFVFWELVTAVLSTDLGINPFEQPDVERTKEAARTMTPEDIPDGTDISLAPGLRLLGKPGSPDASLASFLNEVHSQAVDSRYVILQAFTENRSPTLEAIARLLESGTGTPTAVSYGPQYLHSTGQLHKGGPDGGLFITVIQDAQATIPVPGQDTTFNWLHTAAARADHQVLVELGRTGFGLKIATEESLRPVLEILERPQRS